MTLEQRIEAAARALYECSPEMDQPVDPDNRPTGPAGAVPWQDACEAWPRETGGIRDEAKSILAAAFPELTSSPPTHWVAPMTMTDEMVNAGGYALQSHCSFTMDAARIAYEAARDAYLNREGK